MHSQSCSPIPCKQKNHHNAGNRSQATIESSTFEALDKKKNKLKV
jgi:hypothetical protein